MQAGTPRAQTLPHLGASIPFALLILISPADGSSSTPPSKPVAFMGKHGPLPDSVKARIVGSSWREGCPLAVDALAHVRVNHWGYDGAVHRGELIVDATLAEEIVEIFAELFAAKFPIEKIRLVDVYGASDEKSMEDNNTSAFNCRWIHGRRNVYSNHSYGRAIDINPQTNPYVTKKEVAPRSGAAYVVRTNPTGGMIIKDGPCYRAFVDRGWTWGGDWRSVKDYQHFEKKRTKKRR